MFQTPVPRTLAEKIVAVSAVQAHALAGTLPLAAKDVYETTVRGPAEVLARGAEVAAEAEKEFWRLAAVAQAAHDALLYAARALNASALDAQGRLDHGRVTRMTGGYRILRILTLSRTQLRQRLGGLVVELAKEGRLGFPAEVADRLIAAYGAFVAAVDTLDRAVATRRAAWRARREAETAFSAAYVRFVRGQIGYGGTAAVDWLPHFARGRKTKTAGEGGTTEPTGEGGPSTPNETPVPAAITVQSLATV